MVAPIIILTWAAGFFFLRGNVFVLCWIFLRETIKSLSAEKYYDFCK